jgi:hypothetical protein
VVWAGPARSPFSPGLEWLPERARAGDLLAADAVIVAGDAETHARLAARPELLPLTRAGVWRAYGRADDPAPEGSAPR